MANIGILRHVCGPCLQVPFGYVSLGDVITQGCERPRHHAACIARESGLTALPLDYQLVLMEDDLCIWTPVPPDGETSVAARTFENCTSRGIPPSVITHTPAAHARYLDPLHER